MASELQQDAMDVDSPGVSKDSPCGPQEKGLALYPVSANDSGQGLPYAPEDFPNQGDKWSWRVGKRIGASGYFSDRYTYAPNRKCFPSRPSLELLSNKLMFRSPMEIEEDTGEARCKAGNKSCSSLAVQQDDSFSKLMPCDICCNEPGFCRDCCCILCCRVIDKLSNGYIFIRCEANVEGSICGHSCHIDCALRAYMAGTVGGSIGLDAEYYCRRCDSITDLVLYVEKLVENRESVASEDEFEKILRVGVCVLRGSKKTSAVELLRRIELTRSKLNNGSCLEDIQKENVSADNAGPLPNKELQDYETGPQLSLKFDHRVESLLLEHEIDQTLDALRNSQKMEYNLAKERLSAQKRLMQNLYLQLDKERSELSSHGSSEDRDSLLNAVWIRVDQIKREASKLEKMKQVSKGFGKVPKRILDEKFGLDIELQESC
ncbi:hypothetical protein CASFOL_012826 [Castilleja foliolosa]|uniref:Oberon PHD finger domain-containing protein n=1 Tax=Castilleja foliolosa TaxID=1961234 RepID=A0ABD3DM93_9LAMI